MDRRIGRSEVLEISLDEVARACVTARSAGEFGRRWTLGLRRIAATHLLMTEGTTLSRVQKRTRRDGVIAARTLWIVLSRPRTAREVDLDRVVTADELVAAVDEPTTVDPRVLVYLSQLLADTWLSLGVAWPARNAPSQHWPDAWRWQMVLRGYYLVDRSGAPLIAEWTGGGKSLKLDDIPETDPEWFDEVGFTVRYSLTVSQGPVQWIASAPGSQAGVPWLTTSANFLRATAARYPGVVWTAFGVRMVREGDLEIRGRT